MSIYIEQPDNIAVDNYAYFSPSLLEGFARTTNSVFNTRLMYRRRNDYTNFSPLSSREASTLYHNFYGIQGINASITSADGLYTYKLPKFIDYQEMRTPRSRAGGSVVEASFTDGVPASVTGYMALNATLSSVTSDMQAVFSQTPPSNTDDFTGFRGFGMKLLEISGNIQSSLYGSSVQFYFDIATHNYSVGDPLLPLPIGSMVTNKQQQANNQTYIESGKEWPEKAPRYTGEYTKGSYTFIDNNGNSIIFKTNLILYRVQTTYYIYEPYSDPRLAIGVGLNPLPADPVIEINGKGKFYRYTGEFPQPWHYGI